MSAGPRRLSVEVKIDELENRTRAKAKLNWRDKHLVGVGTARLSPADQNVPAIGDELAAARALADLGHQLLDITASDIESVTHQPVIRLH